MINNFGLKEWAVALANLERACCFAELIIEPFPKDATSAQLLNEAKPEFREALMNLMANSGEIPLSPVVVGLFQRLAARLRDTTVIDAAFLEHVRQTRLAVLDELSQHRFVCIGSEHSDLLDDGSRPFGVLVADTFLDANPDIAAAGRCFALNESTACVFHLMRVVEHGLRHVAVKVGLPADSMAHENWKNIIDQIERKVRELEQTPKSAVKSETLRVYSEAATQFRYFKDAWRNHVSHSRATYTERDADSVWNHVKEFMQHMASIA